MKLQPFIGRGRKLMVHTTIHSMSVSFLIGLTEWILFPETDLLDPMNFTSAK